MSTAEKRVYLLTRDLMFRGKLGVVAERAGATVVGTPAPGVLAVVEIGAAGWEEQIGELRRAGTPVLAFGSHMAADRLGAARAQGAEAVPNSQVERRLAELLRA